MMLKEKILFSKEECESILRNVEKWHDEIQSVRLNNKLTKNGGVMKSFKIDWNEANSWIKDRVINWVNSLNEVLYKINHNKNLNAGYRKYTKGDYFVKHDDIGFYTGDIRLYTIGVMIHKSEDLIGGGLKMYINDDISNIKFKLGNTYIFDSKIPHSVDLIESGERITLMFFIVESDIIKNKKNII